MVRSTKHTNAAPALAPSLTVAVYDGRRALMQVLQTRGHIHRYLQYGTPERESFSTIGIRHGASGQPVTQSHCFGLAAPPQLGPSPHLPRS